MYSDNFINVKWNNFNGHVTNINSISLCTHFCDCCNRFARTQHFNASNKRRQLTKQPPCVRARISAPHTLPNKPHSWGMSTDSCDNIPDLRILNPTCPDGRTERKMSQKMQENGSQIKQCRRNHSRIQRTCSNTWSVISRLTLRMGTTQDQNMEFLT